MDYNVTIRWRAAQVFAYVLIVAIGMFGFWQVDQQNRTRCESANETRGAQRATVMAVYNLAIGVTTQTDERTLPPKERQQLRDYLVRVHTFRREALSKLHPSKACEQFTNQRRNR